MQTAEDIVTINVRGQPVRLRVTTEMERYRVDTYETKEPETLDWLERFHGADDVLFDIGANIGTYALYAALRNPSGRVIAFEPAPANCAALLDNVALNDASNVTVCSFALAAFWKLDFLYLSSGQAGSSMHSLGDEGPLSAFGESTAFRCGVVAMTIDDAVAAGLPSPSLLKLDVDGTEEDVLRGAKKTLRSGSLHSVLIEINWTTEKPGDRALEMIEEAGLRLLGTGRVWERGRMKWQNHLFEKPRR